MGFVKRRWVKKGLLLAFLAVAGILIGEVVGFLTRPSAVDILQSLKAQQLTTRSLYVNGRPLMAEVWVLPQTSSSDPLQKAAEKLLVVGKTVYLFQDDFGQSRGQCSYPSDLPGCDVACDYVIEMGNMRAVIGSTSQGREAFLGAFDGAARAAGWASQLPSDEAFYWMREGRLLMVRLKSFPDGRPSQVALVEQRVQE